MRFAALYPDGEQWGKQLSEKDLQEFHFSGSSYRHDVQRYLTWLKAEYFGNFAVGECADSNRSEFKGCTLKIDVLRYMTSFHMYVHDAPVAIYGGCNTVVRCDNDSSWRIADTPLSKGCI